MAENTGTANHKVKLISAQNRYHCVEFRASPQVTENRNVNYVGLEPLHAPGQIQVYKNTASRSYSISDLKLISRTTEEADANMKVLWQLRAWTMPRFGNSSTLKNRQYLKRSIGSETRLEAEDRVGKTSADEFYGTELLGAPPEVLYLSAYSRQVGSKGAGSQGTEGIDRPGTSVWGVAQHINRIPVVIQQLTIPYPNDVDYINTSSGVPMPIIMNLDLSLIETHSPNSYEAFSLDDFRNGKLKGF